MLGSSIKKDRVSKKWEGTQRIWYKFSKNPLSVIGLFVILIIFFVSIFAPFISPHPESAAAYVNFRGANLPPSLNHLCGTDIFGRDILTRIFFGCRLSIMMALIVISIASSLGVTLGLIAGYNKGKLLDTIIMRTTDIFIAVPAIILALAVCAVTAPGTINAMIAISVSWWPWYAKLTYGVTSSVKGEFFVQAAEVTGASKTHILVKEILLNCLGPILTKMSLDVGWVILIAANLSFVGLVAQPPTPDLGSMVALGSKYIPEQWWIAIFPAIGIILIVLGFNLFGDGLRDVLGSERR